MILRKLFVCWWGGCGMVQRDNATHIWGECMRCGKVAGLVSREAIRRYIETERRNMAAEEHAEFVHRIIARDARKRAQQS